LEGRTVLAVWRVGLAGSAPLDPLTAVSALAQPGVYRFFWEHPSSGFALAAGDCALALEGDGPERFKNVAEPLDALMAGAEGESAAGEPPALPYAVGGFSFFDQLAAPDWLGFKPAQMVLPRWVLVREGTGERPTGQSAVLQAALAPGAAPEPAARRMASDLARLRQTARASARPQPEPTGIRWADQAGERGRWVESVRAARGAIRAGELRKVVLARIRDLVCAPAPSAETMLGRLRSAYPNCYSFLVDAGTERVFLGATPERLARQEHGRVLLGALAGTMPRGAGPQADEALAQALLNSPKERQEHAIVVEAILEAVAPLGTVHRPEGPRLRRYTNVQHLFTPITLAPSAPLSLLMLVGRLHPTPAVGGYPRARALDIIRSTEDFDRGWYAGPVGWLNGAGRGEFAVALRSGLIQGGRVRLFAGGGIVAESDPEREYEETQIKFQPLLAALGQE
jgi:menaquinone-specific isochorismate synthase